jgi:hypothetical protein
MSKPIFLSFFLSLVATSASAQTGLNTYVTSGQLYEQPFSSTTQRYGSGAGAYTRGTFRGQSFNNNSWDTGRARYDNGTIGGRPFSCTTTRIGSLTTTHCN